MGIWFPCVFQEKCFRVFSSVLITEFFLACRYPSYMRNNEESGVLFSPVICYNINGINNRREIVSPRFRKTPSRCVSFTS